MTSGYRQLLRKSATQDDAAFAEYVSDLFFPAHLREASRFAARNEKGIILAPRGHAKTTLFLHRAARLIGVSEGRRRLGILTAVDDDSEARSRAIRDLVQNPLFGEVFPWAGGGVEGRPWTDSAWTIRGVDLGKDHTTLAMSLGSVRAGPRLDELLADDPVGAQENQTGAARTKALETYLTVVDPMLTPTGRRIFLGTRWHEDDIYAELMRRGWPALTRKAIGSDGGALWPDYWSAERLAAKRAEIGSAIFDLQYQNDPSGMDGNIFKRDWFNWVDSVPAGVRRVGLDLAASRNERSDYTAAVEIVEDHSENALYVVAAFAARLDEGHRRWLTGRTDDGSYVETVGDNPPGPRLLWPIKMLPPFFAGATGYPEVPRPLTALNIEATAHQSTFVREILSQTRLPARPVYPDKDKVTRTRTLAARFEGRKVYFLRGGPGMGTGPTDLGDLARQLLAFPNGDHDDLVDAAVYAADLNGTGNDFYFTAGQR
jgi:predicted phage terminase large subunit-like protein